MSPRVGMPVGAAALALHLLTLAVLVALDLAEPGLVPLDLAALGAVAILGGLASTWPSAGLAPLLSVAVLWLVLGIVQHYLLGLTPEWDDRPVRGAAHLLWDLAVHVPPVALAALASRGAPRSAPTPRP